MNSLLFITWNSCTKCSNVTFVLCCQTNGDACRLKVENSLVEYVALLSANLSKGSDSLKKSKYVHIIIYVDKGFSLYLVLVFLCFAFLKLDFTCKNCLCLKKKPANFNTNDSVICKNVPIALEKVLTSLKYTKLAIWMNIFLYFVIKYS